MLKTLLNNDGKPFFSVGGQVNNSTTYDTSRLSNSFKYAKELGLNTIAVPIYWNIVEKEKDKYDVSIVNFLLSKAQEYDLNLSILWFGTYKNGASTFVPNYIKEDNETYWPVYSNNGLITATLSPLCAATKQRDMLALEKVVDRIVKLDKKHNVIAIQIENEPGILGYARDYSNYANELYKDEVPSELIKLAQTSKGILHTFYVENGKKEHSDYLSTFGFFAPDIFMGYYFAKYINDIAEIVKRKSHYLTYVNVWEKENGDRVPGLSYPSGGPNTNNIDIYKTFAPNIDMLCPDIYNQVRDEFFEHCDIYTREDNTLFIPESVPNISQHQFIYKAIEEYGLTGIHLFGLDTCYDDNGLTKSAIELKDSITILNNASSLICKHQGTKNMKAIYQLDNQSYKVFQMDDYLVKVIFLNNNNRDYAHEDAVHRYDDNRFNEKPLGFIFKEDDTFYIVGQGFTLNITYRNSVEQVSESLALDNMHHKNCFRQMIEVSEGSFKDDKYIVTRLRNGDETDFGVWAEADVGIVRAIYKK